MEQTIETDYLIVGAGVMGMSFADVLLSRTDADIVLVDRRHAPGGHWVDAYPFARLHMPTVMYGVDSVPFGGFGPDPDGTPGLLERATAAEICAYYDQVLHQTFLPSGRVRFLGGVEYLGGGRLRGVVSGTDRQVRFKTLVDTTYLEGSIPATSPPPFDIATGVRCIPPGELVHLKEPQDGYTVIGAGKTGQDACNWLLAAGVSPDAIQWVRPRDPWLLPRYGAQPGPGLPGTLDLASRALEAAAEAQSPNDLFKRMETAGVLRRIDPAVWPTAYQAAIVSDRELEQLRRIERVVRRGHVRRIEPETIICDQGEAATTPGTLHIHCAAAGLPTPPPKPIFAEGRITLQRLRHGLAALSAAIVAYVEATRDTIEAKNALCVPQPFHGTPLDWITGRLSDMENTARWKAAPDLAEWYRNTHLGITAALDEVNDDPRVQGTLARIEAVTPAAKANLRRLAVMGANAYNAQD